jgi:DNA polymerase I
MRLILIDGYGFVFRAFHSLPPLTSIKDGSAIGAVYGFANMMLKLLKSHKFEAIAVVLDSGKKNFRHDLYTEYKANRPEPPKELVEQFPKIRDVSKALGIAVIEEDALEADDLIASYGMHAIKNGCQVTVVSSDKDLLQLLPYGIEIYDPLKDSVR